MRSALIFPAIALLSLCAPTAFAAAADEEVETKTTPDPIVAQRLDAKKTPYTVDEEGDYRILVNVKDDRSQLVWVRSVVHETDEQKIREIWTYGLRSEDRSIPTHIANKLLSENMDLIVGAWARQEGNAILIIKVPADASADTLNEAIDLSATIGDRMEKELVTGDDL